MRLHAFTCITTVTCNSADYCTCSLGTVEVGLPTTHGTPPSNKLILRSLATTGALAKLVPAGICPQQMARGLRVPLNPSEVQLQSCAGCCMPAQNTFDPFDHCSLWVRITVGCLVQQTSQAPSSAAGSALLHIQLTALSTNSTHWCTNCLSIKLLQVCNSI